MNTGVSQVFIEGVPRRRFGYFAAAGKVTSVPHKNKTYPHSLRKMWIKNPGPCENRVPDVLMDGFYRPLGA